MLALCCCYVSHRLSFVRIDVQGEEILVGDAELFQTIGWLHMLHLVELRDGVSLSIE